MYSQPSATNTLGAFSIVLVVGVVVGMGLSKLWSIRDKLKS